MFTVQSGYKSCFTSNYKTAGPNRMCNFSLWSFQAVLSPLCKVFSCCSKAIALGAMKGKYDASVTTPTRNSAVIHTNVHFLMQTHIYADRCCNNDIMGSRLLFLHKAKQAWKGLPLHPQSPFPTRIYVIFWKRVAKRNSLPLGLHGSAYVRHAEQNA